MSVIVRVHHVQQLTMTPNKPIITKTTYDQYSAAHIICAFNSTIHLVKETIREQDYLKICSKWETN